MTARDIKKLQIMAITTDGQVLLANNDDHILIDLVVSFCKFVRVKKELVKEVDLTEFIGNGTKVEQLRKEAKNG